MRGLVALALLCAGCAAGGGAHGERIGLLHLESPAGLHTAEPNLAAGAGTVVLSWIETAPEGTPTLWAARAALGSGPPQWSEPFPVAREPEMFVNWADFPALAVLEDGSLAAHWLVRRGPQPYAYDIRFAVSRDGGRTWSAAASPHHDGTEAEHGFASLVPEPGGGLSVVWLDGRRMALGEPAAATELRYARWQDGAFGEERVLDSRVCDCCQTAAVRTSEGLLVAYRDRSDTEVRDIAVVRQTPDGWSEPALLHEEDWKIEGCPVNGPALAARNDEVAAAWFTAAPEPSVYVAFSRDGGASFTAPHRVDGGDALGRVAVAWLGDGSAVVAWLERAGERARVRLRRADPAGPHRDTYTLATTSAARASGFPRLVPAGERAVLAAWTETGEPSRVRLARVSFAPSAGSRPRQP